QWRKSQKFSELKFLTNVSERENLGRLVIGSFDGQAEIVYFPQGTTTTREMLALTQRQPLPNGIQKVIKGIDPPRLDIEWTGDTGEFHVMGHWDDGSTTSTELIAGRFDGVTDSAYTGPGVKDLLSNTKSSKGA